MSVIAQIISEKGHDVFTSNQSDTVLQALAVMEEHNIGAVMVTDDSGKLVGIFSERDYARKVVLRGKRSATTAVSEVMTSEVKTVTPKTRLETCMELMTDHRIRHLPVMEDDKVVGMVSIGDIVRSVIRNQRETIRDLEGYIIGGAGA